MKRARSPFVVRALAELGDAITLAPERHLAARLMGHHGSRAADGEPLSALVVERSERVTEGALAGAVVFDTTHAKDGLLDAPAALRASSPPSSAKKRVCAGDLLVSRLRPYLRQIAFVHEGLLAECGPRRMACSTEFYVLSPRAGGSLAFLLPWLLSSDAQAILAAAQEGGHHPRVPREMLLAMHVDRARIAARGPTSARVEKVLAAVYAARRALGSVLEE